MQAVRRKVGNILIREAESMQTTGHIAHYALFQLRALITEETAEW